MKFVFNRNPFCRENHIGWLEFQKTNQCHPAKFLTMLRKKVKNLKDAQRKKVKFEGFRKSSRQKIVATERSLYKIRKAAYKSGRQKETKKGIVNRL